jgi:hypothetical protein
MIRPLPQGPATRSRFLFVIAIVFAGLSAIYPTSAQQITSDVVISGATLHDQYELFAYCDDDGEFYRRPRAARPGSQAVSIMRVAKDGSTLLFTLPPPEWAIEVLAPTAAGLAVLTKPFDAAGPVAGLMHMYRFDRQGHLQTERSSLILDFQPVAMTETKSGMTVVVGYRSQTIEGKEVRTYGGAILNASNHVVKLFDFPPTSDGGNWAIGPFPRTTGGDRSASIILESGLDPIYSLASISDSGEIHILPLATVRGARSHDWFFGKGVAAEEYQFASDKPRSPIKIDAFDLTSGRKINTKVLPFLGFSVACYLGNEISILANTPHADKSRGLLPEMLRLVTVKFE